MSSCKPKKLRQYNIFFIYRRKIESVSIIYKYVRLFNHILLLISEHQITDT